MANSFPPMQFPQYIPEERESSSDSMDEPSLSDEARTILERAAAEIAQREYPGPELLEKARQSLVEYDPVYAHLSNRTVEDVCAAYLNSVQVHFTQEAQAFLLQVAQVKADSSQLQPHWLLDNPLFLDVLRADLAAIDVPASEAPLSVLVNEISALFEEVHPYNADYQARLVDSMAAELELTEEGIQVFQQNVYGQSQERLLQGLKAHTDSVYLRSRLAYYIEKYHKFGALTSQVSWNIQKSLDLNSEELEKFVVFLEQAFDEAHDASTLTRDDMTSFSARDAMGRHDLDLSVVQEQVEVYVGHKLDKLVQKLPQVQQHHPVREGYLDQFGDISPEFAQQLGNLLGYVQTEQPSLVQSREFLLAITRVFALNGLFLTQQEAQSVFEDYAAYQPEQASEHVVSEPSESLPDLSEPPSSRPDLQSQAEEGQNLERLKNEVQQLVEERAYILHELSDNTSAELTQAFQKHANLKDQLIKKSQEEAKLTELRNQIEQERKNQKCYENALRKLQDMQKNYEVYMNEARNPTSSLHRSSELESKVSECHTELKHAVEDCEEKIQKTVKHLQPFREGYRHVISLTVVGIFTVAVLVWQNTSITIIN